MVEVYYTVDYISLLRIACFS